MCIILCQQAERQFISAGRVPSERINWLGCLKDGCPFTVVAVGARLQQAVGVEGVLRAVRIRKREIAAAVLHQRGEANHRARGARRAASRRAPKTPKWPKIDYGIAAAMPLPAFCP